MNKLGTVLIIIGILCIFSSASSDDYYMEIGEQYPLINIILWLLIGLMSIIVGCKMKRLF